MIIFGILAVGFAFAISQVTSYDGYNERLEGYYAGYEETYGIKFDISQEEYAALSEEDAKKYDEAYKALTADGDVTYVYTMVVNLTLVITSISILLAYLALEFVCPLILKNGQTPGKKVFGLGIIHPDGVKINTITLFIRTILGKYTIETMIPVLIIIMIYFNSIGIVGAAVLGAILLLQIILLSATRTNSAIHDLLANTVVIDMSSQMIFESENAMIEYKKKKSAEIAARHEY